MTTYVTVSRLVSLTLKINTEVKLTAAGSLIDPGGTQVGDFDLEPTQNCITGQDSLVSTHQSQGYMLHYQATER